MKTMTFLFAMIFGMFTLNAQAQEKVESGKKIETIEIKTSAVCGMCKKTIEGALFGVKGVTAADLDVATKIATVSYKPAKVSAEEIKRAITMVGYDADQLAADAQAYDKLHFCCKKDAAH